MSKQHKTKRRLILGIVTVVCILATMVVFVSAAYFAKGEFKDVFVNKKDFFSANVLYNIGSVDAEKHEVGSSGVQHDIMIYNYDVSTGDFNSFDIEFDVYVWLDRTFTDERAYVISDGSGNRKSINTLEHTEPVFRNLKLEGGQRSIETLTVNFGFGEGEDLTNLPGLYVVAVPTSPRRLSTYLLGALIRPTRSDAFDVNSYFDDTGSVEDYAAFTYRVNTVGVASEWDKIRIKWKSDALILMRVNGGAPESEEKYAITKDENGFDRMIEWNAQSDHTDYFVFFRNAEAEMWKTESQTWEQVYAQIVTEYVKNTQE